MQRTFAFIVCVFLCAASGLWGQNLTSINGVVADPTGAVIPGAAVRLENIQTQALRESKSDDEGRYQFVQVQPGEYRLRVTAQGFPETVVNEIRLLVNTPATVNVTFEKVGSVTETVSVSAEAIQINTQDATIGNTFGTKPILQLPFEGRNVVGLLSLQPGVTFLGETPPGLNNDYRSGSVNGGRSDQANVTLDGVDVNDQQNRNAFTSVLRVTLDSVQEFRVITTNANADMGRSSGAQVSLVTKSGTNSFHGSLYEYLRNKKTNANDFFSNAAGTPLNKLNRNVYGGSLGGPILRNRLFFFANYEGRKDRTETVVNRTVPTPTLRQGQLGYLREVAQGGGTVYLSPEQVRTLVDPSGIGASQAALAVFNRYPLPNNTTVGDGINSAGYLFNAPTTLDWHTYILRLDYNLSQNNQVFIRGNLQDDKRTDAPQFPGLAPNNTGLNNSKGLAVGVNSVLSPNLVNTFRYGYTRQGFEDTGVSLDPRVSFRLLSDVQGFTRPFIRLTPVHSIADDITWTRGTHTLQGGFFLRGIRNNRTSYANSFPTASLNSSWLAQSGGDLNRNLPDLRATYRTAFRDAAVAVLGVVAQGDISYNYDIQGNALPVGAPNRRQFNAEEYEFYVQDTWRATRALTLTAGIRYSLMPPVYEANGLQVSPVPRLNDWFDQRVALANAGLGQNLVEPVRYVLRDQGGRDLYPFHKNNWAPRFSLAYSPQGDSGLSRFLFGGPGRTAIRAGWGMFYDLVGAGLITSFDQSSLGLTTALTNASSSLTSATAPRFTSVTAVPPSILEPAPPSNFPVTAPNVFAITNSLDDSLKMPYTMNMNFSIGREFGGGFFVQGSYVGRLSRRSLVSEDLATPTNVRDPRSGQTYFEAATALARLSEAGTPVASVQPIPFWENLFPGIAGNGLTATQVAFRSFDANAPDYTSALYDFDVACAPACSTLGRYAFFNRQFSYLRALRSVGNGNYHAMQWTARKRFGTGDQVEFNYTLSKSIDLGSGTEAQALLGAAFNTYSIITQPFDRRQFRAVSDYDVRHNWNANVVYGLPFGRGRGLLDRGGWVNAIVGGWQLGGLYRQSSGLPTGVGNGRFWPTNWNLTGNATQLRDVESGSYKNAPAPPGGTSGPNLFANPEDALEAFGFTLPGQTGSRNTLRGDGFFNIDANLAKRFDMPFEGHSLQFRWEVFNVTNTARFDVISLSLSRGVAGSFGRYSGTLSPPRVMQFALRYEF